MKRFVFPAVLLPCVSCAVASPEYGVIWTPKTTYTLASWSPLREKPNLFGVQWLKGDVSLAGGTDTNGALTTGMVGSVGVSIDSTHEFDIGGFLHMDQGSKPALGLFFGFSGSF